MFVSRLGFLAACLSLVAKGACQELAYDIPPEEVEALAGIVEDEPPPPPAVIKRGSDPSPPYNYIYQKPLPIPPVKQPAK